METGPTSRKRTTAASKQLPPGIGDNPFSELIAMMLFTGPVDGCTCKLCELCRKAKLEMADRFIKGGKM